MNAGDATQVLPAPSWSDPRVHLLDDTWLLTVFAVLLATVVPWLVSGLDINFIGACLGLLALGALHIALTVYGKPARFGRRRALLSTLHVIGILLLGFIWLQTGGLHNPAFLMVFALPVVGAIFLSRWQPYVMALLALTIVGAVALAQAPELRWYAPGLNTLGASLATLLGQQGASATGPFPGFYAPSGYYVVLLEVFAILVFACAVASEYLGTVFERLHSHVDVARTEAERGQEFWANLIEGLPMPALLVDADTLQIVRASNAAAEYVSGEMSPESTLFEAIRFTYPDVVQELINVTGGVAPLSMIRVGDRMFAAQVHVQHVAQKGRRFALVVIDDRTDEFTVRAALDVSGQAVLVMDSHGRILAFNKPAQALFAALELGSYAAELLALSGMPTRWWEPGLSGRRKMHVEIGPRVYQVTCSSSPMPGEEERLFVVTFLPVARATAGDVNAITATTPKMVGTSSTRVSNSSIASSP